jgi:hypothetical protein
LLPCVAALPLHLLACAAGSLPPSPAVYCLQRCSLTTEAVGQDSLPNPLSLPCICIVGTCYLSIILC